MLLENMNDLNIRLFLSKTIKPRAFNRLVYSYIAEEYYKRMFS